MFCVVSGIHSYAVCWVWYIKLCFALGLVHKIIFFVGSRVCSFVLCLGMVYTVMFCVRPDIYIYVVCWVCYKQLCRVGSGIYSYCVLCLVYAVMFCVGSGI